MKDFKLYLLLGLVILFLIVFIVAGKVSPAYKEPVKQTINCASVNINFSYSNISNITAAEGTNTPLTIYVNNTGNVTELISLKVSPVSSVPFSLESGNSSELNVSKEGSISFGIYSPTKTGNYKIVANLSSSYLNCFNYKLIPINVKVVNSSS